MNNKICIERKKIDKDMNMYPCQIALCTSFNILLDYFNYKAKDKNSSTYNEKMFD